MNDERILRRAADQSARRAARRVGWLRIGLGLAGLIDPVRLGRLTGLSGHEGLVRAVGLRELVTGIGLVVSREPRQWMWACVGGDAMDLAVLATQSRMDPLQAPRAAASLVAVAGIAAADARLARRMTPALAAHEPLVDYRDRSGFPKSPDEMRGAALRSFEAPADMLPPAALRPYPLH